MRLMPLWYEFLRIFLDSHRSGQHPKRLPVFFCYFAYVLFKQYDYWENDSDLIIFRDPMDNKEKDQNICPYVNMHSCPSIADDEIKLLDIWNVIWTQRILIVGITMFVTLAFISYAFFSPKIYESKVRVLPVSDFDKQLLVDGFTFQLSTPDDAFFVKVPTPNTVFSDVAQNLQNKAVHAQFWDESEIIKQLSSGESIQSSTVFSKQWFFKNLAIKASKVRNKSITSVTVSFAGNTPQIASDVLRSFISYVDEYTLKSFRDDLSTQLELMTIDIENQIKFQHQLVMKEKEIAIAELTDAKIIAEKLGLNELPANFVNRPLYARGVKAIEIEIEALTQKENGDLFNAELFSLQSKLAELKALTLDNVKITIFETEKVAQPLDPVKPKSKLIVCLGFITGVMIGIVAGFFRNFIQQRHKHIPA